MNSNMVEQVKAICGKYQSSNALHIAENLTANELQYISKLLNLPANTQVIGFINDGVQVMSAFGVAICDSGVFWKNDPSTRPILGTVYYSELAKLTFKSGVFDITFSDGKKISDFAENAASHLNRDGYSAANAGRKYNSV